MSNKLKFRKLIGENIRYFRRKCNLSQEELALRASLSTDFISKVERGVANISADSLYSIGEVLEIHPYLLLVTELKRAKEMQGEE
jgi:transcriptional regulator with XRE-family HTH domain